jgi:hypothetical protein
MGEDIESAQRKLTARVMGKPGVSGTAIGMKSGKPCLKVYLSGPDASGSVPKRVGGFPVVVESTGKFRRL